MINKKNTILSLNYIYNMIKNKFVTKFIIRIIGIENLMLLKNGKINGKKFNWSEISGIYSQI